MEADDEITALIQRYLQPWTQRRERERSEHTKLLAKGEAVVLPLIQALRTAKKRGAFLQAMRLGKLLAEIGDPRATSALIELVLWDLDQNTTPILHTLLSAMRDKNDSVTTKALIEIVRELRYVHSGLAIRAATLLVEHAQQTPTQEFAEALPLLHSGILYPRSPLEFGPLRRQLKAALRLTNLPLTASPPQTAENLPLPAEKETHE